MLSKLATFLYIHCVVYRRSIVDRRKALFLVMAHLHYRRRTRTRTPLLYRNRVYDLSLSLCNVNMFCIVQCSHWVSNYLSLSLYPSPSLAM